MNSVAGAELGHDVVVVGVEPFGHLAGCDTAAAVGMLIGRLGRTATRHAEVVVQRVAVEAAHALRQVARA